MLEKKLTQFISNGLQSLYQYSVAAGNLNVQPTRKEFEGTYTFVVYSIVKIIKSNPEQIGNELGQWLVNNTGFVEDYNVVKGFLNISLKHKVWVTYLHELKHNEKYGILPRNGEKAMVEFSSPNTNKPLHLGHLRNNFLGDSTAKILDACGYEVLKVNLVNDRGIHICKSMLAYKNSGKAETPESSGMKGDHLIGKYYVEFDKTYKKEVVQMVSDGVSNDKAKKEAPVMVQAQELLMKWEKGDSETVGLWKKMNEWVYEGFNETYDTMGIYFDKMYKESNTYLLGKEIVEEGLKKNILFKKEDGSVWIDLKEEGLDEKLLLRANGTAVYMTQDLGTCDMKYRDFPFNKSVFVVGNEQDYHFKVLFTIMKKLGRPYADGLFHLSYGMIDLPSGKMKSREGTVVDADHLIQEMLNTAEKHTKELGKTDGLSQEDAKKLFETIGLGALKYFLLKVDPKKRMLFNPKESIEFQGHTGPFIQYTYARIAAILRRASSLEINISFQPKYIEKIHNREVELIHLLSNYENALEEAGKNYSPALLAQYVYDLAKNYNGFYQELPIFNVEDVNIMGFRITLSQVTGKLIKNAMSLLGIKVPERM